ncbi:GMC oxidoreductase [Geodermatophilus sp. SYSU D00684]
MIVSRVADLRRLPHTDLLVVGGGATGLSLARLVRRARPQASILVVEQGGSRSVEIPAASDGTGHAGLGGMGMGVGGSAALWAGQAMRFDEADFRARPWVRDSGWPISRVDLLPHYHRMEQVLGVGDLLTTGRPSLPHGIEQHTSVFAPARDLARGWRKEYADTPGHHIVLGMKAAGVLRTDQRVTGVTLTDGSGTRVDIPADVVVLAAGAVENTRLLLQPTATDPAGLAHGNRWAGACFQDHANGRVATITGSGMSTLRDRFGPAHRDGARVLPKLALCDAVQADEQVLGVGCVFTYDYPDGALTGELRAVESLLRGRHYAGAVAGAARAAARHPVTTVRLATSREARRRYVGTPAAVGVHLFGEQEPDPANRITLSTERDGFGLLRPHVSWRIGDGVRRSMQVFLDRLAQLLAAEGLGRLEVDGRLHGEQWTSLLEDNKHHAGTARMSASPQGGVVDLDCRVHGLRNLYVTGGAVFPTSSWMNPTLTMLALVSRLADHLARELR